jgi:hypothetical protein
MKNLRHPNFILSVISLIILLFGIGLRANGYYFGDYVIGASILIGAVHWIWAIVDVIKRTDMKAFQKRFWFLIVVCCPVLGGMLFYAMHQERDKIVT